MYLTKNNKYQSKKHLQDFLLQFQNNWVIVIYITNAVGYILQREVFSMKHDREAGVF
jgi:hypothetical protein